MKKVSEQVIKFYKKYSLYFINIVIRSWKVHRQSRTAQPPQDFITINKLAIKMNATNFNTNKDFRKNIDIRQKVRHGKIEKKIYHQKNSLMVYPIDLQLLSKMLFIMLMETE